MRDSYVVQVYRRDSVDPDRLTGTVERIGNGQARTFNSMTELWSFLATQPPARLRRPARAGSSAPADKVPTSNRRKP
jgi:hypothetical protein